MVAASSDEIRYRRHVDGAAGASSAVHDALVITQIFMPQLRSDFENPRTFCGQALARGNANYETFANMSALYRALPLA